MILLSDVDGLYTGDPRTHEDAEFLSEVKVLTPEILSLGEGEGSALGTGGMRTKLHAAETATSAGIDMVIANGSRPSVLYDIVEGRPCGTKFSGRREEI